MGRCSCRWWEYVIDAGQHGSDPQGIFVRGSDAEQLLTEVTLRGPLLARLVDSGAEGGEVSEFLVPAPLDCVFFGDAGEGQQKERYRLAPRVGLQGSQTDLDADQDQHAEWTRWLELVGLREVSPGSKAKPGPAFWSWSDLESWLIAPSDKEQINASFGVDKLSVETRTHAALDSSQRTYADGQLFETQQLRFERRDGGAVERFGLVFQPNVPLTAQASAVVCLGGERRISVMRPSTSAWPKLPDGNEWSRLRSGSEQKRSSTRLRVVLLTPALFDGGFAPKDGKILGAQIVAARVGRPLAISGWDFKRGRPKSTRQMVAAGSVYWVELSEGTCMSEWVEGVWMENISSDAQDCRDGFGLAVVGVA